MSQKIYHKPINHLRYSRKDEDQILEYFAPSINYQNTSINKLIDSKKRSQLHEKHLIEQQKIIKEKQEIHRNLSAKFDYIKEKLLEVTSMLENQRVIDNKMQMASIRIQKVARGFIARKKIENVKFTQELIDAKRKTTKEKIDDMDQRTGHYMYQVGKLPEISAWKIQKAYKRYLVRSKCYRLIHTYKIIMTLKEEENYKNLKANIRILYGRFALKSLKTQKFIKNRLEVIKIKLALIKIKKIFKKMKWKRQVILDKIKKYKRRIRAAIKRKTKRMLSMKNENNEWSVDQNIENDRFSINSEEDFETTTSDRGPKKEQMSSRS
jgi:IQ calmodulin-binding motif